MDKVGIRTIVVNFDDEQLPYLSLVQGDAKTRGFDIVICDSDGKEIPPSDDYIVELVATGSNAPDTPYANRHTIKDGKYRVMIPTEALSESGFVFLQLVFYQKSTGAVIHTIEQKCPVYRSRGQEVVESNNLYVDITALRLGLEKIEKLDGKYEEIIEKDMEIQANEAERKEAEKKRNLEEVIRQDNETIRKSNEVKREQLKTALIELKNSIESDLESINLTVDDIISSEDDRKQNEIVREEIKAELENLVADIQNKLDNGDFVGEKGEQGIQGEQGPQGPPGEVSQEELDNFKDANSLKIANLEKELQNYKSTMANINANQEVKQSVSGYGSVNLPKNTANGQVSNVQILGVSATNIIDNGDFASQSTGWVGIDAVVDGVAEKTATKRYGAITKNLTSKIPLYAGHKLYVMAKFKASSSSVALSCNDGINALAWHSGSGNFEIKSLVMSVSPTPRTLTINVQDNADSGWQKFYVDYIFAVDLTTTFGVGNEPTKEECDKIFANWFDGTKSTNSASRLKSVDKDGIQESTSYLPNVGELRSLPNGVCDEVRVNGGKAEKVQRVSETMEELAEPIITPIEVNGTLLSYPSGTVYVEKVLPVAGIYTDEITIAHTDFPISSLDKISKIDFATGVETQLDVSKAVVATDKLSFTHTDLTSGDIVFFEYFYANESTQGKLELEYYDSRHVLKDSVTGKFYKIIPTVANGVLTNGLLEV